RGSAAMTQAVFRKKSTLSTLLTLQECGLVDLDHAAVAHHGEYDGEADRRLRSRHGHHEERENRRAGRGLGTRLPVVAAERDQVQIDAIEHDLDEHQDPRGVLLGKGAPQPQTEQEGAETELIIDRHFHYDSASFAVRMMAPIMAISSRTEAISNGIT